jgi:hypothetical protein
MDCNCIAYAYVASDDWLSNEDPISAGTQGIHMQGCIGRGW